MRFHATNHELILIIYTSCTQHNDRKDTSRVRAFGIRCSCCFWIFFVLFYNHFNAWGWFFRGGLPKRNNAYVAMRILFNEYSTFISLIGKREEEERRKKKTFCKLFRQIVSLLKWWCVYSFVPWHNFLSNLMFEFNSDWYPALYETQYKTNPL